MRHIVALFVKTFMIAVVLFIIMNMLYNYPVGSTFALALLVTGLAYLIGDLAILPMTNNTVATLADLGLATLTIWLLGPFVVGASIPFSVAFIAGVVIAVGEWFFHKLASRSLLPRKDTI